MKYAEYIWPLVWWAILFFIVDWLVGGSVWLSVILAGALSSISDLSFRIANNKQLYDITDAELVRVSGLAHRLEELVGKLELDLEEAESKIWNLESDLAQLRNRI